MAARTFCPGWPRGPGLFTDDEMKPDYSRDGIELYRGDCLEVLGHLPAESIHAVVTDPPYGLSFMGKDWDHGVVRAVAGETFAIRYVDSTRTEALRRLGQWASDPELPFAWWDAAEMARLIRENH